MTRAAVWSAVVGLGALLQVAAAQFPQPNGGGLEQGTLPFQLESGVAKCMEAPDWQVHEYNANLYILRQSGCTDAEMPFLYLFFGKERGLLWDTGSRNGRLGPEFQRLVHLWLERNHRASIPLVVMHSHSHEDHVWGGKEIQALNDPAIPITFLPAKVEDTSKFFGIAHWPTDRGSIDLGERKLDIIPIPGHDVVSLALYDAKTGIVLTGDSLYPGRLYMRDYAEFRASTERLIAFLKDKPVAHVLGNHIEQSRTPFLDYPIGSIYHPDEHQLDLSYGTLLELEEGLKSMEGRPRRLAMRDFTIWPVGLDHGLGTEMDQVFKKTSDQQQRDKWNQPK